MEAKVVNIRPFNFSARDVPSHLGILDLHQRDGAPTAIPNI